MTTKTKDAALTEVKVSVAQAQERLDKFLGCLADGKFSWKNHNLKFENPLQYLELSYVIHDLEEAVGWLYSIQDIDPIIPCHHHRGE